MKTYVKTFASSPGTVLKMFSVMLYLSIIINQHALGQFTDTFADGDFTNNPTWTGATSDFKINSSNQLQLNSAAAGTAGLVVPFSFIALGESQWVFNIQQLFSSSSTNYGRVYLMSDQENLSGPLNGYYLQFGEAGSADAVELFRQTGSSPPVSVCRATDGAISGAFNITVKVTRSITGKWELWIDYAGGTNFMPGDSATDNIHKETAYFGIRCTYTITNATRFIFDDFNVTASAAPDKQPPFAASATAISSTELQVMFSEPVTSTAEVTSNYSIDNGNINPVSAALQPDQKNVILTFATPFANGSAQPLFVTGVADLANNIIIPSQISFLFFRPVAAESQDIVINEIFADFSPPVALPEGEFVELYNRSKKAFNLSGWQITDGSSAGTLTNTFFLPGQYIILSATSSATLFSSFGKTMGISSFPSLNNSGDHITLKDAQGKIIDTVNYSSAWYKDDDKKDGGWTLERIDTEDFCSESENWKASINATGGTPGQQNSVYAITPDVTGPKMSSVLVISQNAVTILFDEKLSDAGIAMESFSIEPSIEISNVSFADATRTRVQLDLLTALDSTSTYKLSVTNIRDCTGNVIQPEFSAVTFKSDTQKPEVNSITVVSSSALKILFSERISKTSGENLNNYQIVNGAAPSSAIMSVDEKSVLLTFASAFVNGLTNTLHIENISDRANNQLTAIQKSFTFFQPSPVAFKDIIVTEIFADPSPQIKLPEAEFIELFNRSQSPFDLNGWTLSDGTTTATLGQQILLPSSYLIVCVASKAPLFSSYGNPMGTTTFPSLNNSNDMLVLKDMPGITVDSVSYADAWYRDDEKKDGGWTLELIDPMNICSESENWTASEDERGGTPGVQNSVLENKPDLTGPKLISATPTTSTQMVLKFNEKLEKILPKRSQLLISPTVSISHISFPDPSLTSLLIDFEELLQPGIEYELITKDIFDCSGNKIQEEFRRTTFALPEMADSLDLIVNEILFNPRPTGVDFVEVYNQSSRFINLKNWWLANRDGDGNVENKKKISETDYLVKPRQYIVFTQDANVLKGEYLQGKEETFYEVEVPSLPDDAGSIVVISSEENTIDEFRYSDQMHSVFIKDNEGVSLERINISGASNDSQNWKSASSAAGFSTPGYLNSNATQTLMPGENVGVEPEIFMPLSGRPDFTQIKWRFDRGGYVANVKIFDAQGREIKDIANNEIIGTEGFFRWDGDQNNGSKARIGSYMVWFEIFDDRGTVKTFRKRIVVADKF